MEIVHPVSDIFCGTGTKDRKGRKNKSLVFYKADKGAATVIMDKKYYLAEGYLKKFWCFHR